MRCVVASVRWCIGMGGSVIVMVVEWLRLLVVAKRYIYIYIFEMGGGSLQSRRRSAELNFSTSFVK